MEMTIPRTRNVSQHYPCRHGGGWNCLHYHQAMRPQDGVNKIGHQRAPIAHILGHGSTGWRAVIQYIATVIIM
ncbi:uncharacterized protein VTP21DRAFT_3214 [Calcarisporiella thermophila]|uniref:uncharacterized protein n=1 Tax=Calcarisporiella thermophila TaxID=911321 RepID=UPI0037442751